MQQKSGPAPVVSGMIREYRRRSWLFFRRLLYYRTCHGALHGSYYGHSENSIMDHALCDMHHVSCIMRHALCVMHHVSCAMRHASCVMHHASCAMRVCSYGLLPGKTAIIICGCKIWIEMQKGAECPWMTT